MFAARQQTIYENLQQAYSLYYYLPSAFCDNKAQVEIKIEYLLTHDLLLTHELLPCNTSMKFPEFEKFISSNRSIRFQSVRFDNVQRGCVIEFFKKILETTEAFDSDSFYVKFEHEIFAIKTIHGVLHVPASYVDLDKANRRKVNLDEFVPGKGHSIKNLRNYRVLSKKCCGNFD
ncbi:hypothetical protein Ddc_13134 [Ditylenchus destructor]|nr:hypothetical protein Ddc_13134 [Ditylenchus destructor]